MEKLTKNQEELLNEIIGYKYRFGFSPSFRELAELTDKKSISTIKQRLEILKRKGYIVYEPSKSRTIRVINENE